MFLRSLEHSSIFERWIGLFSNVPTALLKLLSSTLSNNRIKLQHQPYPSFSKPKFLSMALARLALKKLQQRITPLSAVSSLSCDGAGERGERLCRKWRTEILRKFTSDLDSSKSAQTSEGNEVAVTKAEKSKLFPRKNRKKWLRKNNDRDYVPALYEFFPSGLGNALIQATDHINRLFDKLELTPWAISGRVKEKDDHYKLRFELPGIPKEDVKITVSDGVLTIKGEHKEEAGDQSSDDEGWTASSYGYYNTSLTIPDDAKVEEIKAELKDGILKITIPKSEETKKDVKEIQLH